MLRRRLRSFRNQAEPNSHIITNRRIFVLNLTTRSGRGRTNTSVGSVCEGSVARRCDHYSVRWFIEAAWGDSRYNSEERAEIVLLNARLTPHQGGRSEAGAGAGEARDVERAGVIPIRQVCRERTRSIRR